MRLFWMVMRYQDSMLHQHPNYSQRNVFYMGDIGKRGDITQVLFPSLALAEEAAFNMAQTFPTETILIMEQKSMYELPELPSPIKKKFNSSGELIPDAT